MHRSATRASGIGLVYPLYVHGFRRVALGAALLAAGLLAAPLQAPHAHGAIACRSDPIVTLD